MVNDVTRTGTAPPPWVPTNWVNSHLWLLPPFTTDLLNDVRYGHHLSPGASTQFDSWGVGDSGNEGTLVDIVPYTVGFDWYGRRVNCEAQNGGTGAIPANRTNLQTFLVVQGLTVPPGLKAGSGKRVGVKTRMDWKNRDATTRRIQGYVTSKELRDALIKRRALVDSRRNGGR
jgi:hypothetical protein